MVGPALAARGLSLGYGAGPDVLVGVDLALAPGTITALVGGNGSGKSTLLRACAGLLRPRAGSVCAVGEDLAACPPQRRARLVALVPQALEAIPPLRVADFVLGGRYAHLGFFRSVTSSDRAAAAEALRRTDATSHAHRLLGELSGGERQRVLVARALAQDAAILLCDEPTAALDPQHQIDLLDVLRGIADAGRAIAIATHDLNLASQYADEVVVLHGGRVDAQGTPAVAFAPEVLARVYGPRVQTAGAFAPGRPILLAHRAR